MGVKKLPQDGDDDGTREDGGVDFSMMEVVAEAPADDVSSRQRTLGFMRAWVADVEAGPEPEPTSCLPPPSDLVQLQPHPYRTRVGYHPVIGGDVTLIHRWWRPGDTERCALCPAGLCCASDGSCAINVDGKVPKADAPLYDSTPAAGLVRDRERVGRVFLDNLGAGHVGRGG
jgi:hypothetical protein